MASSRTGEDDSSGAAEWYGRMAATASSCGVAQGGSACGGTGRGATGGDARRRAATGGLRRFHLKMHRSARAGAAESDWSGGLRWSTVDSSDDRRAHDESPCPSISDGPTDVRYAAWSSSAAARGAVQTANATDHGVIRSIGSKKRKT